MPEIEIADHDAHESRLYLEYEEPRAYAGESYEIIEARRSLYRFLDDCALEYIDQVIFLAPEAELIVVESGYDRSTFGSPKDSDDRLMFSDAIDLQQLLAYPTGDTHRTYESGRGMAATTHGDELLKEANEWSDWWFESFTSDWPSDEEERDVKFEEFAMAGLTTADDWLSDLTGTLADLRERVTRNRPNDVE
ncbi:hypothetical protein LOC72_10780 [Roseiconus lacunae]|nr:hypothetical protein [Roseiconus lacunae]